MPAGNEGLLDQPVVWARRAGCGHDCEGKDARPIVDGRSDYLPWLEFEIRQMGRAL